jgi:hypothetical protein
VVYLEERVAQLEEVVGKLGPELGDIKKRQESVDQLTLSRMLLQDVRQLILLEIIEHVGQPP